MATAEQGLREFMERKDLSVAITEMDKPDVMLWCIWAIQQYAKEVGTEQCIEKYGKLLHDLLTYIIDGKHPNPLS